MENIKININVLLVSMCLFFSCSHQQKCLSYNSYDLNKDQFILNHMKIQKHTVEGIGDEVIFVKIDDLQNYKIIGEFEIVKFIEMKQYLISPVFTIIFSSNINPLKIFIFNNEVTTILMKSNAQAKEIAEKNNVKYICYYGSKTNADVEYVKKTIFYDFRYECDHYLLSKYLLLDKIK